MRNRYPSKLFVSAILVISQFFFIGLATAQKGLVAQLRGSGGINRPEQQKKPYVILVSFDGFRADYLDRYEAPNFRRVMRQGVRADGLIPVFPSKTFPNHYSIVTGLYTEQHGLVANSFYDPRRDASYGLSDRAAVSDGSWYGGEPLWVTAEKQGMVTACFFWPGSEAAIKRIRPTYWKQYDTKTPNEDRVNGVLAWLRLPAEKRPHFITLYMSDVDSAGHKYGPATPEVGAAVKRVDQQLGRLLDGVEGLEIRNEVYLALVSDHGMTESSPEQYVSIDSLIDMDGVRVADGGPNANLHVSGGLRRAQEIRAEINRKLQHGRAYLRSEIPDRLHYRNNSRIGDVIVIMEEHYQIGLGERAPDAAGGAHGWDPATPSMHGIFVAMGPGMSKGGTIPRFSNIHIYRFLAETLKLKTPAGLNDRPGYLRERLIPHEPKGSRIDN